MGHQCAPTKKEMNLHENLKSMYAFLTDYILRVHGPGSAFRLPCTGPGDTELRGSIQVCAYENPTASVLLSNALSRCFLI